jgi:hypothetical protein
VLVTLFTAQSSQIPIHLQVSDDNGNIVIQTNELQVTKEIPVELTLTIPCHDLPKPKDSTSQPYVTVRAISSSFGFLSSRTAAVRYSPSIVLTQTDKPVYTKNDRVNIYAVILDRNFVPCCTGDGKVGR